MAIRPSDRFAGEQAALRRVATLVAGAAEPAEVFAAVTAEAGRLLEAHHASMSRYGLDGKTMVVAAWNSTSVAFPIGTRWSIGGQNLHTMVFQTGRAARIDDYTGASGPVAEAAREIGLRAGAGVPISVEDRLWGVMLVESTQEPLPAGTEARVSAAATPRPSGSARSSASASPPNCSAGCSSPSWAGEPPAPAHYGPALRWWSWPCRWRCRWAPRRLQRPPSA
jgi:hypothetical protein